jgi:hypothetical protein
LTVVQDAGAIEVCDGVAPGVNDGVDPGLAVPDVAVADVAVPGVAEPSRDGDALPGEVTDPDPAEGVGVGPPPRAPEQPVRTSALARRNSPRHRCAGFMNEA